MKLHLIRHGDTEGTERRLYYGRTDLPLSPAGAETLRQRRLSGDYPTATPGRIYTTGMTRTEETLALLYGDLPHGVLPQLREVNLGIFEMRSHQEMTGEPEYEKWISGDYLENIPPGGESFAQFSRRVLAGLDALLESLEGDGDEDIIIVCHGGTIAMIMMHFFPREEKTTYDWIPNPGEGFTVLMGEAPTYYQLPTPNWMGKGYSFVQNTGCEYFPCHQIDSVEGFNCLFCYCPLYGLGSHCGGDFSYTEQGVKNCTNCTIPHRRENYGRILSQMKKIQKLAEN